ncbi:hypothetical protein MCP_2351 [Methanocella paludicola SANAE]|uniref:Uncharacterized protein n=1 Tax=Methanocella paludicola (strain DSM 17711 / JCM 13418 / NBRC 101707 / SANAE) TaxID=304371 RepID=D1Z151_METPS|nr:hypothetical protein [Methanocella paludicola]BAI62423.1 hypothetical protein MCP_2351 [Methanocella paludicola SANAE]
MRLISIIIAISLSAIAAAGLISWPALASLNQPAQVIGMPFISTDCVTYAMPASFGGFVCIEFNSTFLEQRDLEKLDIDFPLFTDATVAGPAVMDADSGETTANVLPFGPVDLAFPSISQVADQSIKYSDTYFFTDTIGIGG